MYAENREREERWNLFLFVWKHYAPVNGSGCHTYVRPERAVNTFLRVHHDLFHPIASIIQTLRRAGYRCTTATTTTTPATITTTATTSTSVALASRSHHCRRYRRHSPHCNRPFIRAATSVNSSAPLWLTFSLWILYFMITNIDRTREMLYVHFGKSNFPRTGSIEEKIYMARLS